MPLSDHTSDALLGSWMRAALGVAVEGVAQGESPFGAVIVGPDGQLASREHNQVFSLNDPVAHAEVRAISAVGRETLSCGAAAGYWLVSTGEPCAMCLATAAIAGIRRIAFGATADSIQHAGYETLGVRAEQLAKQLGVEILIRGPVLELECAALLLNHPQTDCGRGSNTT